MTDFTIVIPAYNDVGLLRRALQSVLAQRDVSFDIVVTDDSTTDDVESFVHGLSTGDIALTYRHNRPPLGAASNWNQGLQMAKGRYILLLHHDEALSDDHHLATAARHLQAGADIVVADVRVWTDNQPTGHHFAPALKRFFVNRPTWLFLLNVVGPCACVAFRSELREPFDDRLRWVVDVEWYYRLFRHRHVVYDEQLTISSVHGHAGQITGGLNVAETFSRDRRLVAGTHRRLAVRLMLMLHRVLVIAPKQLLRR